MDLVRRHWLGILGFPIGLILVSLLAHALVQCVPALTQWTRGASVILLGPAVMVAAAVLVTLAFYGIAGPRRQAEWSLLLPVLAGATTMGVYWNTLLMIWLLIATAEESILAMGVNGLLLLGFCFFGAALAGRVVSTSSAGVQQPRLQQEGIAVGMLILFSEASRIILWPVVEAFGWAGGWTSRTSFDGLQERMLLSYGLLFISVLAAWLLVWRIFGRRAGAPGRWQWMALPGVWITAEWVLDRLARLPLAMEWTQRTWAQLPLVLQSCLQPLVDHERVVRIFCGMMAGVLAILYSRLVVARLWRRAFKAPAARDAPSPGV